MHADNEVKPGYLATEFWVTLLTDIAPILTLIFKEDVTPNVQIWSVTAAGIATAVYTLGRTFVKTSRDDAKSKLDLAAIEQATKTVSISSIPLTANTVNGVPVGTTSTTNAVVTYLTDVGTVGHSTARADEEPQGQDFANPADIKRAVGDTIDPE